AARPVITTSAPCSSASTIGRAPRYADANSGSPGKSSKLTPDSAFANVVPASRSSGSRGLRSSPSTVATRIPDTPSCLAVFIAAPRRGGVCDPPPVREARRGARGRRRARLGEVPGQVARVPEGLVALAVLLQDRQRQLGQRLEAQVVDPVGKEPVDGRGGVP